jgi:AcrR family transcriptional regulator
MARELIGEPMDEVKPARRWRQTRDGARAQKAAATRQALITAARALFAEHGYHGVGVRDVTARAGVTRGALAHHFGGKEALFLAVFDAVERELIATSAAERAADAAADPWAGFRAGVQLYLDAVTQPDVQRITLIDGPAVLGWKRWRELEDDYSLGGLTAVIEAAMAAGRLRPRPVEPLAQLIVGAVMEAALLIANAGDPARRRREVGDALDDLLRGLA